MIYCEGCIDKQAEIFRLKEENSRLKQQLYYLEKKSKDGYFGSSTPSSKKPFKENSKETPKNKNGGAVKGHKGNGRKSINENEADIVKNIDIGNICPHCQTDLIDKGPTDRTVVDSDLIKIEKILYKYNKKWCPNCHKTINILPVLPKFLYGNQLLAQVAVMHFVNGVPIGRIEEIFGLPSACLYDTFHRLAKLWDPAMSEIKKDLRSEKVKHADETGWRTDGHSGYAWLFSGDKTSIFQFKDTRSARIAKSILGEEKLPGTLVVDRYAGYNKIKCKIQYCYSHLLRKIEDLGKEFLDEPEVQNFVGEFAPLISKAIHLRYTNISDKKYYSEAKLLKKKILKIINAPAKHLGIQDIQWIFKKNINRLYHWVNDRDIPADNNKAERELRPTVIARKVSFGSQSPKGADTHSVMMTILHTAKKRIKNQTLAEWFKEALDKIAFNPNILPYSLFPT